MRFAVKIQSFKQATTLFLYQHLRPRLITGTVITIPSGSYVMKMQFSAPVNRTGHRYDITTGDRQVCSAVSLFCAFIFTIGQLKSGQETGEREVMTCSKGPQDRIESVATALRRQPLYVVRLLYQLSNYQLKNLVCI